MKILNETVRIKSWQVVAMVGASGFAFGTTLSRVTNALGF